MRSDQVTCWCSAYKFPHRIGGGRCSGEDWAQSAKMYEARTSLLCVEDKGHTCAVVEGRESIAVCQIYQEHLHYQPGIKYPADIEDYYG